MIFRKVLGCVLFKKDSSIPWKYLQFLGGISLFLAEMFNFYYYSWPLTRISFLGLGGVGRFFFPQCVPIKFSMVFHQVPKGFPSVSEKCSLRFSRWHQLLSDMVCRSDCINGEPTFKWQHLYASILRNAQCFKNK